MFDKLEAVVQKYHDINSRLSSGTITPNEIRDLSKEQAAIKPTVEGFQLYKKLVQEIEDSKQLLETENDEDMRGMAKEELKNLEEQKAQAQESLKFLLLPKDPNDEKNTVLEIRAGTGGEEAALFANELFRMYSRFAESNQWKVELLSMSEAGKGGLKEVIVLITGQNVYSRLKFESGIHRVQRVPETESSGRVHTSAVSVAVMPEAEDVDVEIDETELRIDVMRAGGAGGQHVNKTESAVRLTHLPTGIVVICQDERSQHKNKAKAMKVLRSRLLDKAINDQHQSEAAQRKTMVGSGDRSEKIRTYNFPQSRVTDHRINLTLYKLDEVMEGGLVDLIDPLTAHQQALLLKDNTSP